MLRDSQGFETKIIDAVRSVNRALGGATGSTADRRSDYNQYEVQLIDAIRAIGRTLSGSGLSLAGGGVGDVSGFATVQQFQDLSRRVSKLEDESFFRLVDGNVTLKSQYQNLWVPGWLAAGGVGEGGGGGGGGGSVDHLSDIGDVSISDLADGQGIVWDATNNVWKNATVGGGGGSGSVTSVGVTVPAGLSVTGSPVTSSGTIAISYASGYKIPTTSKQSSWDAKQNAISDLSTIRSNASHGQTAYGWGDHSQAGYLTSYTETDPTVPSWAKASSLQFSALPALWVGSSRVQSASGAQALTGISSIKATVSSDSETASLVVWEPDAGGTGVGAWHFCGNVYADGWVSAGGVGQYGPGGGGASTLAQLNDVSLSGIADGDLLTYIASAGRWSNMRRANYLSGYATQSWVQQQGYLTSFTETDPTVPSWAKASSKPSYSLSEISGTSDLQAIEALSGTSGLLRKTAANTWSLDTTTYLTSGTTLDSIADGSTRKLADYVTLGTAQTITGAKTFSGGIVMSGADIYPSADLGSKLGYSTMRFSNACIRDIYAQGIRFRNSANNANTGLISFSLGYMQLQAGSNIDSSFKQLIFDETNGFYPFHSGVNLGYNSATSRWANIYGVNADLSGDLSMTQSSHIDIGPLRIEYDATNKALHITKASSSDTNTYGIYADGFVAAGGVGQTS